MIILGLAGQARVGKDTVASYLREAYGFIPFSFSDVLYQQVQIAFGLLDQDLLRDATTKDVPSDRLTLQQCADEGFVLVARRMLAELHPDTFGDLDSIAMSPRQVTQWWGTDYRRAEDPDYWVKQSHEFVRAMQACAPYPEMRPQYFVNMSTRFLNEQKWIHACGGNVWHIHRDGIAAVNAHVSETPLEVLEGERELWNNDTIERLHAGIDTLLHTGYKFVRVEPTAPMVEPPMVEDTAGLLAAFADVGDSHSELDVDPMTDPAYAVAESNCAVAERIQ